MATRKNAPKKSAESLKSKVPAKKTSAKTKPAKAVKKQPVPAGGDALSAVKNGVITSNKFTAATVLKDNTLINMQAIGRHYKLNNAYKNVRNLKLNDPLYKRFDSYAEHRLKFKDYYQFLPLIEEMPRPSFNSNEAYLNSYSLFRFLKGRVLILVHKDVYAATRVNVERFVLDLARDGYWATVHVVRGGGPSYIKNYIKGKSRVGVIMVGAVAPAWFEMTDDFDGADTEFPCDLYYTTLNGTWADADNDGKFNAVSGDMTPEIWLGRIWTPTQNGNDAPLINDYFERNHRFRTGQLGHSRSALAYVEDDWVDFDDCEMDQMVPASFITKFTNPDTTDADLYKTEVNKLRSFVQLCSHSSPHVHSFRIPSTNSKEWIYNSYFRDERSPNAHFYNLFCCSSARFTESEYIGGWYIFDKEGGEISNGLTAIGSTKTGSMLFFADFYKPLGEGKCIGDAMVSWWQARGNVHELWQRQWFYGMSILGDPTLAWSKGAVPVLSAPADGKVFNNYPRKTDFSWGAVGIPGATYSIEIDAFGAIKAGEWAAQSFKTFAVYHDIHGTSFTHNFVGAQPGRWRVRAKIGDRYCSWSPWRYFRYTI